MFPLSDVAHKGLNPAQMHALIADKLITDDFSSKERYALAPFIRIIGIPDNYQEIYSAMWDENVVDRETLLSVIFHSREGRRRFEAMTEEQRIATATPWIYPMMELASVEEFPAHALASLYNATTKRHRPTLVAKMESIRYAVGAPTSVYRHCFSLQGFALPH